MPQARGRSRELAILSVVRDLLAEVGYERLTVDAVVTTARASKATIYSRWPDKASLVAAALNARAEDQPRTPPEAVDLSDDLRHFVAVCAQIADAESVRSFVEVLLASDDEPALAEVVRGTALAPRREDCVDICRRAVARGELADGSAAPLIFELVMGHILVRYVLERSPLGPEEQVAFVDEVLLPVLTAPRRSLV